MNNNNSNWTNNRRGGKESPRMGKGRGYGKGSRRNRQYNNPRTKGGEKHFQKFADTDHKNEESNSWQQNDWNSDYNRNNNNHGNGSVPGAGIFPWIRERPVNPLIMPHHINFEQQYNEYQEELPSVKNVINKQNAPMAVENHSVSQVNDKEVNVCNNEKDSVNHVNHVSDVETSKLPAETNTSIKIKQEKDLLVNLKQEKKSSSSSSSSSSSESSLSEEEPNHKTKHSVAVKLESIPISKPLSSPLDIKLKPKADPVISAPVKISKNVEAVPAASSTSSSSSSSSSSDDESRSLPVTSNKSGVKPNKKENSQTPSNELKNTKKKNSSEDDVVCVGNLERQIVLEDDGDETVESDREQEGKVLKKSKKSLKKSSTEKCMICDKKGHTSFQCQMICKNCSAPYHGYRTCPQPANLNTMLQLFIEFCMKQFQSFNAETQTATNPCDNVPKRPVESQHLISASNKLGKLKRKHINANDINIKTKSSKKRKITASKKTKSKTNSDDSSDDDNDEDDTDSQTSSTELDEDISDSSVESKLSSKKKRKIKNKNASNAVLNLSNFTTNPVNLPMVLNGFPNLTLPTTSLQNTNNSTNALNTLLLTQMFQNAFDSLKK